MSAPGRACRDRAEINLDLAAYVRTVCGILDIPIYGSLTESLHVLFSLYSDFKANVHFQQQLEASEAPNGAMGFDGGGAEAMSFEAGGFDDAPTDLS